jgi:hypothetical protein
MKGNTPEIGAVLEIYGKNGAVMAPFLGFHGIMWILTCPVVVFSLLHMCLKRSGGGRVKLSYK